MTKITEVRLGERWAFRVSANSRVFHEALVRALGKQSPPKVRIELVADEWQGERRWVPPSRLEVRWDDRRDYIELDEKFRAVRASSPGQLDRRTAEHIFINLIPLEIAEFNADSAGTSVVHDVPGLSHLTGLSQDELRDQPAFLHEQDLHIPWATTERIARAAAARRPHALLHEIEQEEGSQARASRDGVILTDFDGHDHHLSPDEARARFELRHRPYLDKLRSYIGIERANDLLERRELLGRLGQAASVAERALDVLEPTQKRIAWKLREELAAALDGVDFLPPGGLST